MSSNVVTKPYPFIRIGSLALNTSLQSVRTLFAAALNEPLPPHWHLFLQPDADNTDAIFVAHAADGNTIALPAAGMDFPTSQDLFVAAAVENEVVNVLCYAKYQPPQLSLKYSMEVTASIPYPPGPDEAVGYDAISESGSMSGVDNNDIGRVMFVAFTATNNARFELRFDNQAAYDAFQLLLAAGGELRVDVPSASADDNKIIDDVLYLPFSAAYDGNPTPIPFVNNSPGYRSVFWNLNEEDDGAATAFQYWTLAETNTVEVWSYA